MLASPTAACREITPSWPTAHPRRLRLQDSQGADVCLLLTALWLERRGVAVTAERAAALEQLARPWRQAVIAPLRQVRRDWKGAATSDGELAELHRQLAALELQAERLLLERLERLAGSWTAPATSGPAPHCGAWLECLGPGDGGAHQLLRAAAAALAQP